MNAPFARNSKLVRRRLALSLAGVVSLAGTALAQTNGTWTLNGSGNWSATANWSGGTVAGGTGAAANISTLNITANQTITLDTAVTVGSIVFQDATTASNAWTLAGANVLTLDVASGTASLRVLNQTATISAPIAGSDGITILSPTASGGGTLVLSGVNTFTNVLTLNSGALVNLGNAAALGASGVGNETVVNAGATLNINGIAVTAGEVIKIAGFGAGTTGAALLNNGGGQNNALSSVVLTNNAAVGGSGRFDIRTGTPSLDLAGFRLTKIGANQFSLVNANVTAGNIDVNAGTLSIEAGSNIKGAGAINVQTGATLGLWNNTAGAQTRSVVLANGATITELGSSSLTSTFSAPIVLAGNASVNVNPGTGTTLTLPRGIQQVGGSWGITKGAAGQLALAPSNFTGAFAINAGTVTLTGGPSSLSTRQILMGDGAVFNPGGTYEQPGGGTLTVGRSAAAATDINGAVVLAPGGTMNVGAFNAVRTASINGDLTLNGNSIDMDLANVATSADLVAVTGNINVNGANSINLRPVFGQDYTAGSGFATGSYTIATYTGALGGAGSLTVGNASQYRQTFAVDPVSTPGQVKLVVSGSSLPVSWTATGGSGVWDAGGATNWFGLAPGDKFYHLDQANFDGSDSASDVRINGVVMPASILVDAAGLNYNWIGSGAISGPGGLNISGGNLSIRGEAHDFSGAVTITGGQVNVRTLSTNATPGSLGTGAITISNGTLNFDGGTLSSGRNLTLGLTPGDTGRIRVADSLSNVTLNGSIAGPGTLTKTGNGILTLGSTGANFSAASVSVLAGSLKVGTNTVLGTRTVSVASGATFDANGIAGNATTGGNPVAAGTRPTIEIVGTGMPGQAAFWNGGGAQTNLNIAGKIIMTGDATYGTPVRYDLNNSTAGVLNADGVVGLTFQGGTNTLTLVGTGEKWWAPNAGATVGKIVINQGRLGVQSTNNLGDTTYPIVINSVGELATFGDNTNGKPIQLNGGSIGSTGGGTVGQVWNGGITVTANSFLNNLGNAVTNKVTFDNATFSLGGFTVNKIGGNNQNGEMVIRNTVGTGDGTINIYTGTITANTNAVINGGGVIGLKGGTFNLDDTGGAATLSKTLQLNGGLFQNVTGSHTIGLVNTVGHGRLFNNAVGTSLTLGDVTLPAATGIQFGTTGDVVLTTINGAAPVVGTLGVGILAGPAPATTGFATWDGTKVGVAPTTNTNFAGATAVDDVIVNAATTLAASQTVNSLIVEQNLTYGANQTVTLNSGGLIIRANNSTIGTTAANAGNLTSGAADGRLVWNGPETFEARGTADLRVNLVNYDLPSGGFRPVTLVKNGPGGLTGMGIDTANAMLTSTYSGGTVINSGRLVPAGSTALGMGPITVRDGGQLGLFAMTPTTSNLASYIQNNITAAGRGAQEAGGIWGSLRLATNTLLSGNITLADQARLHNQNTDNAAISGLISGTSGLQKTGGNSVFLTNPASTLTGVVEVGFRDQVGGVLNVARLANGGQPSSIGASSSDAANIVLHNSTLRYVGPGDSTDRLVTLGQGWNLGGTPTSTIEAAGFGALNLTNSGNIGFGEGSFRILQLTAGILNNGANVVNGQLPVNTFAPVLGDPSGANDHGFGQLTKSGQGTWVILNDQTYSGSTTLNDGVLRVGNGGTTGSLGVGVLGANTVTLANSADLQINRSNTYNYNHTTTGSGAGGDTELVQMGSGTTVVGGSGDNGSLRLRVENGVLELGKNTSTGVHAAALGVTINGGTLRLGGTGTSVTGTSLTSVIGENQVDQIFDGAATGNAAGTVIMNAGTFDLNGRSEAISRLDGAGGTVTNTAPGTISTLNLGTGNVSSFEGTRAAIIDGAGQVALAKVGTGTSVIISNNSFTGGTTVRQGVLQVGNGGATGTLGSGSITVQANGVLALNRSDTYTISNAITGNGTLAQNGTGVTRIDSPLGLIGGINVNQGTLMVDVSAADNHLNSATAITGNGGKMQIVGTGASGVQNLTGYFGVAGSDYQAAGAQVGLPASWTRFSGGSADFSLVGGGSAFNTTIANVNGVVGTAQAAYSTFNGADWATQTAGTLGAFSGYTADTYTSGTHTNVSTDAAFAAATSTSTLRFNGAGAVDLGLDGQTLTLEQGGILVSPNVGANVTKISGGTLTGANSAASEVLIHQHNLAAAAEVSAVVANNGANLTSLSKAGAGTLILTGTNTYGGETHINQGTLQVGAGGTAGTLGTGPVYNDAALVFNRSDTVVVDNPIGGSGSLLVSGGGTVNLRGANNFTGGLTVSSGTVRTDRGNLLTNLTGVLAQHNNHASALDALGGNGFGQGTITLGDANTGSGNVALLVDGGADLANPIVVSASGTGAVTIGSGLSPASGVNGVLFDGPVTLNRATTFQAGNNDRTTFTNVISGNAGTITIAGGGRVTWENDNTFTAGISLTGTNTVLQVGTGAFANPKNQIPDDAAVTLGAGTILQLNGDSEIIGTLNSTANDSKIRGIAGGPTVLTVASGGTFNGIVHGNDGTAFTLESTGGDLTLGGTADNNTGRILVNGGTVILAKESTTGVHAAAVDLTMNSGTIQLAGTGTGIVGIAGANQVDQIYDGTSVVINGGTFDLNGKSEGIARLDGYGGIITNNAAGTTSTLNVGNGTNNQGNLSNLLTAGYAGTLQNGAGVLALNKMGNGVAIFTGNLNHTGGTNVAAGALQIGNGSSSGSLSGNVTLASATSQLVFNVGIAATIPAAVSGSGMVISNGSALLSLTGSNTYTGPTAINAGIVEVGNGGTTGTIGTGNITIQENTILKFNRSDALTVTALMAGGGQVEQIGAGTTTLTGISTHTGQTIVRAGTLKIDLSGSLNGSSTFVENTGTLDVVGAVNAALTTVNAGGTLRGTGVLDDVTVLGGTVAPGPSSGTLTTADIAFNGSSTLLWDLDVAGTVGSGVNDLLQVNGSLTLDGTLQVQPLGGFTYGTYRLINYTGTLTDNTLDLPPSFLAAYPGSSVDSTISNQINLIVVPEPSTAALGGLALLALVRRRRR